MSLAATIMVGCADYHEGDSHLGGFSGASVVSEEPTNDYRPGLEAIDLGTIFGDGKTIESRFPVKNPTATPIRLIHADALAPCCSSIKLRPAAIAPRDAVEVPVTFRPGYSDGPRRVEFVVATDSPEIPRYHLVLTAEVISCFNVAPIKALTKDDGGEQQRAFLITCRRTADRGLELPEGIEADAGLTAEFLGDPAMKTTDGLIESSQVLQITIDPTNEPGFHQAYARLRWKDGSTRSLPVSWRVEPPLTASPTGFVLRSLGEAGVEREIVLRSSSEPFRILDVRGPAIRIEPLPSREPARLHWVRLRLDEGKISPGQASEIRLITDHPAQSEVGVTVLLVDAAG